MSKRMRRLRGGLFSLELDEFEAGLMRRLVGELLELLAEGDPQGGRDVELDDPLSELAVGPANPPDDPVLARLFPDAYRDDPEAAGEFRHYTEVDLRADKRANARTVLRTLDERPANGRRIELDGAAARAWLLCLNDLRLALGTRLDVTEDYEELVDSLDEDDPRRPALGLYEWLTALQDTLVRALA